MKILRHAHIVTMDDDNHEFQDGYIAFDETGIKKLGEERDIPENLKPLEHENLHGALVLPAFCNTHTHLGMIPFRSLADDMPDRLRRFLMPLENKAMTRELAVASAKMAIAEMLLSGTASAVDMYFFEADIAKASQEMGFRLWAGETFLDAPHCDAKDFSGGFEVLESIMKLSSNLIIPVAAPHAPYSVSLANLHSCADFAKANNLMWTMHLSEMPYEIELFKNSCGLSPVQKLHQEKLLSENLIAVHLLLVNDHDIRLLSDNGVGISHCPGSNSKAGKGVAPVTEMIEAGCTVTIGTDGPASGNTLDMFTQMKLYAILQKNRLHDRSAVPARDILPLVTRNAGLILKSNIGQLIAGFKADIQVLSFDRPNMTPCYDAFSSIVYSAQPQNVKDVYVNGRQLVKDSNLCAIDYGAIREEFNEASADFERQARSLL